MTPPTIGMLTAGVLFALGAVGVIARRNFLFVLMSIEIMLNAAGLAFISGSAMHAGTPAQADGQAFFLFILPVAAAEVAIGLALAMLIYQRYGTLDLWALSRVKEEEE